jgi:SNF2 family DNA or RNA helicase
MAPEKYSLINCDKLYSYQEHNVNWMISVEQTQPTWSAEWAEACTLSSNYDVIFDSNTDTFYSTDTYPKNNYIKVKHKFRGGFLADEMGCGKTACVIELISRTLPKPIKKFTRDPQTRLVVTNATLIIVPVHLIDQWSQEIIKFAPNLKVLKIFNKISLDNVSYGDITSTDVVIVSYSLFSNKTFRSICYDEMQYYTKKSDMRNTYQVIRNYKTLLNESVDESLTANTKLPNIMFISWRRIVLDECQTLLQVKNMRSMFAILHVIDTKYFWNVSGTPFTSYESLSQLTSLLVTRDNLSLVKNNYHYGTISSNIAYSKFLSAKDLINFYKDQKEFRKIYRRNTKESTNHETSLSKIKLSYKMRSIEFTNEERIIYESNLLTNSQLFIRQFCCCPFAPNSLSNCKSFDAIMESVTDTANKQLAATLLNKKQIESSLAIASNRLVESANANFVTDIMRAQLERNVKVQQKNFEKVEEKIKNIKSSIKFYENLANTIKQDDEIECKICYDIVPCKDFKITMTKCGHMYCTDCVNLLFGNRNNLIPCPDCRKPLKLSTDTFKIGTPSYASKFDKLYNELGTKCATMVKDINKLLKSNENKIIIFVEWDIVMMKLSEALKKYNINVALCKGNKSIREAAIKKFNNPNSSCRVIMLCSSYASSGANLTSANKIIIANPVGTDKKEREAIESQAIARAYRLGQTRDLEVIRYVIKDTIEEEIYNKTK